MIRNILMGGLVVLLLSGVYSCREKVPLSKEKFTSLLLDMHRVDGTLSVNRSSGGKHDLKNYAYYNYLFRKYGITRAEFDSCMYYYSAQTVAFSKMYDMIIDSLNKQLTAVDMVLNALKANDSVNYFPVSDTIRLDNVYRVVVDSIVPGLYKFSTTLQFDSVTSVRLRRISSFFLSGNGADTLKIRDIIVVPDTNRRNYNWSQYADSVYSRLVINYMEEIPADKRFPSYKKGKLVKPDKKEKVYDLKDFGGKSWNNQLFRPYISRETEKRLKQGIRRN